LLDFIKECPQSEEGEVWITNLMGAFIDFYFWNDKDTIMFFTPTRESKTFNFSELRRNNKVPFSQEMYVKPNVSFAWIRNLEYSCSFN